MSSACRLVGDKWWIGGTLDVILGYSLDANTGIRLNMDPVTARAVGAALILRADEIERMHSDRGLEISRTVKVVREHSGGLS